MKNLEKFQDAQEKNVQIESTDKVVGGIAINSPYTIKNIDEAMDLYWVLFDITRP
jgi:hypothetical protein